jgi:hypothetical protein
MQSQSESQVVAWLDRQAAESVWITGTGKAHAQAAEAGKEAPIPDSSLKESYWFVVVHQIGMLPLSIQ